MSSRHGSDSPEKRMDVLGIHGKYISWSKAVTGREMSFSRSMVVPRSVECTGAWSLGVK